ncbi:helix-turn-helix domain-containing protein [Phaeodactylibacter luteus]|uniref:Helix-turn-helix domain-containing protein n=1 Tax=Phaeodactylibacter luteus TaxID=1564516 RepID=A0A5C6RVM9_9BACT|nr:XRE family transcriptional regulator [Phaeodactylibacter luteus]TXB65610.1 helix-turn-helix domain-containing protein [Phaeodactylibacter luteus]
MVDPQDVIKMIFGFKAKYLRQKLGLSLEELAERAHLSKSYLHDIEKGKKYPKVNKIQALAAALGVDYDYMVSTRASKKLQPIVDLLTSDFIKEFPLDLFGISPEKLFELFSNTPDKVNAFISTIFKITRNYQMQREHLYLAALRSYQDMYDNYFADLEAAVKAFRESTGLYASPGSPPEVLEQILQERYGIRTDYTAMPRAAELRSLRSHYQPGSKTLFINRGLSPAQTRFLLGRELAFQYLELGERPYFTRIIEIDSFERLLNNFKASYFAVALMMDEAHMIADLKGLAGQAEWRPELISGLLERYDVTPEMLLQRWSNLLPQHFGIKDLFFIRLVGAAGLQHFRMTKELHLSQMHNPYANQMNEHYCRRWVSVNLIKQLKSGQHTGSAPIIDAQISEYWQTDNRYLCISLAKPDFHQPEQGVSVTIGLMINEQLRRHFRFIDSPGLPSRLVHTTCERCGISDCEARAVAPTVLEQQRAKEEILRAGATLRAGG